MRVLHVASPVQTVRLGDLDPGLDPSDAKSCDVCTVTGELPLWVGWGSLGCASWVKLAGCLAPAAKSLANSCPPVSCGPTYAGTTSCAIILGRGSATALAGPWWGLRGWTDRSGPRTPPDPLPPIMRRLRTCPWTTGWTLSPVLGLFLPDVRGLPASWFVSVVRFIFQYLHVPCAGVPVQAVPRSVGRLANFPQVVHSHLASSPPTTLTSVWFAVRSPKVIFFAAFSNLRLRW